MYLAELELHGFKSFAQKTTVKFGSGITAIVGPNGCGKSNIVDALRWALGEQRPSLLRSNAMTNVIFNGTASKKPLGLAEVSITINNNKGILPTEFNDITITRRLYRSGDSEYLLNKVPCRLKDIVELFMDTGMGSNAYSVIELKMVEEILADKNNDRRKLFEEAAGVTKYKEKRKQTIKKLEETRTDMLRIEDILVEIRKKVKSLQIQAGRAQRAKQYEEDLHRYDKALSRYEYNTIIAELTPMMDRVLNAEKEKEELQRQLDQTEQQKILAKDTLTEKETDQTHALRNVNRLSEEIREADTTLSISQEKIISEQNVISQYENDVSLSEVEIKDFKKLISKSEKELETAESILSAAKERMELAKEELQNVRDEVSTIRSRSEDISAKYREATIELGALQNKRIRAESRIESIDDEILRLEKQLEKSLLDEELFSDEFKKLKFSHAQADEAYTLAESRYVEALKEQIHLNESISQLKDKLRLEQSKLDALKNEVALLESLSKSDDALPFAVKFLKQNATIFSRFELIADIFSISDELTVALEAALGDAVNYIIVNTIDEANEAFELLRRDKKGKTTIIPLDLLSGTDSDPLDGSLYYEVRSAPKYDSLKKILLGNVRLFETVEQALNQTEAHGTYVGVTHSGELIHHQAFIKSGSAQKNEGLRVGLQERIKKLSNQLEQAEIRVEDFNAQLHHSNHSLSQLPIQALQLHVKTCDADLRKIENQQNSFQARKQVYDKNVSELKDRKQRVVDSKANIQHELDAFGPDFEKVQKRIDDLMNEQHQHKSELQKYEDNQIRIQSRFSEAQLGYQQEFNKVENIRKDIERSKVGIAGIMKRLELRAESAKDSKNKILALKTEVEELKIRVESLRKDKVEADELFTETEETVARQRGRINQIDEDLVELRRKKDINVDLVHHLGMAKSRFDMQSKAIADHIWEAYGLLMDQVQDQMPDDIEPSAVKEQITLLKERLKNIGEVNKLAISEYDQEKERLDTFESQMADLNDAEEKLRQTISEINHTANERFSKTFEEIRVNFQTVFHTLFEENDHCDLLLENNEEDPLDRKINIIANPRGKRPSNIEQLSGGEKTLTAIALLFAIYLVKPSPFCILDEVDAPLDDANVERFTSMIKKFSKSTQFVIITHNKKTMEKSEMLYGVTMQEMGVSKLVAVKMDDAVAEL
jgi:chromosome segregation protein